MAFVMIATGATSRSRVRTLSVRPLVAAAGLAALALLGSGGAVGYWVAEFAAREVTPIAAAASSAIAATPAKAISGRTAKVLTRDRLFAPVAIITNAMPTPSDRGGERFVASPVAGPHEHPRRSQS